MEEEDKLYVIKVRDSFVKRTYSGGTCLVDDVNDATSFVSLDSILSATYALGVSYKVSEIKLYSVELQKRYALGKHIKSIGV